MGKFLALLGVDGQECQYPGYKRMPFDIMANKISFPECQMMSGRTREIKYCVVKSTEQQKLEEPYAINRIEPSIFVGYGVTPVIILKIA